MMSVKITYFIYFFVAFVGGFLANATSADPTQTYDILYNDAVNAYLDENWDGCVRLMNEAIEDYHFHIDTLVGCRMQCRKEVVSVSATETEMKFWERMVKQTLCLLRCKKLLFRNRAEIVAKNVMEDFENLKPYDYLQLCYYKTNNVHKAASSAYTFLTMNPGHEVMQSNLRYYINTLAVDPDLIVNIEAKPYVSLYVRGSASYKKADYQRAANYMELSLQEYLHSDDQCRVMCEGPFDQGWFPDFISSISNHYTFTLKCKQKCAKKLGNLNGEIHDDLFASHYHYLQFIYYKLGNTYKALEATASYLLFFPDDETMIANKKFYLTLPDVKEESFKIRPEALEYYERDISEKSLLKYIDDHFQFEEGDISEATVEEDNHISNA